MVYRCYADDCFYHSSGPWKKHKYIKKVGNKYIYANNGSTSSYKLRGEAAGKKARAFIQKMRAKVAQYHSIGKQLVDGFINGLLGRSTVPAGPISANISQSHAWQKQGYSGNSTKKPSNSSSTKKSPSGRPQATSTKSKDTVKGGGPTTKSAGSLAVRGVGEGRNKLGLVEKKKKKYKKQWVTTLPR